MNDDSIFSVDSVVSGDVYYDSNYPPNNWGVQQLLIWNKAENHWSDNYWLAPDSMQGEFILKFDQPRIVHTITIVNTHNSVWQDRGTNEFKVTKIYFN